MKNRNEQAASRKDKAEKPAPSDRGVYKSGVVEKELIAELERFKDADLWPEGENPPWSIVERYLATGEHREQIEEHARRSKAFAAVLEALRNDEEDHDDWGESGAASDACEPSSSDEPPPRGGHLRLVR